MNPLYQEMSIVRLIIDPRGQLVLQWIGRGRAVSVRPSASGAGSGWCGEEGERPMNR